MKKYLLGICLGLVLALLMAFAIPRHPTITIDLGDDPATEAAIFFDTYAPHSTHTLPHGPSTMTVIQNGAGEWTVSCPGGGSVTVIIEEG